MAFAPNGQLFVNDVGQGTWEEIDDVLAGADYGWNVREGRSSTRSSTNCGAAPAGPDRSRASATTAGRAPAISGGAFVPAAALAS